MATEKLAEGIRGFSAGVWLQTPLLSSPLRCSTLLYSRRTHPSLTSGCMFLRAELVRVFLHARACVRVRVRVRFLCDRSAQAGGSG